MAADDIPGLLSPAEVGAMLGLSVGHVNRLRVTGDGPPYVKMGRRVGYQSTDVAAWIEARKRISTRAGAGE